MKEIKVIPLASAFAGCFLGAGFVSGQELWQFFGEFGVKGYIGLILACVLLAAFGIIMMRLMQEAGIEKAEEIMVPWNVPFLRTLAGVILNVFLLGVVIIMTAGVGATMEQLLSVPSQIASALFVLLMGIVALLGVSGMMKVFSALVPTIVLATVFFAVMSWIEFGTDGILALPEQTHNNPLMPNWIIAALTYVAYNLLGSVGIMAPLERYLKNKRTIRWGIALGGLLLVLVAGSVLTSLAGYLGATQEQMPMVALASRLNAALGIVHGVLLLLGMFSNGLASLVAFMEYVNRNVKVLNEHRKITMAVLMLLVWAASLAGFGNLVGTVFPVFGYIGIVAIVCICINYIKCMRRKKSEMEKAITDGEKN